MRDWKTISTVGLLALIAAAANNIVTGKHGGELLLFGIICFAVGHFKCRIEKRP